MMRALVAAAAIVTIVISGCMNNADNPMMTNGTPANIAVTPNDGATNVRLDAGVALTFRNSVDRSVAERSIHLLSEKDMADSTCAVSTTMGHGMMDAAMADSSMMNHLGERHGTRGHFQWNGDSTGCEFRPDSLLLPGMRYMIHMGRELTQMIEERMGAMGGMSGHGSGMMSRDMMYHFRTIDTTGSGHESHH